MPKIGRYIGWRPLWPLFIGGLYFVCAWLGLEFASQTAGIATVWPASGILVAGLLLASRRRWAYIVAAAAVAGMASNLLEGTPVLQSIGFTLANLVEACIVVSIAKVPWRKVTFHDPRWIARFCFAVVAGAMASGTLSLLITAASAGAPTYAFGLSWFATAALGMLIVTPLFVTIAHGLEELRTKSTGANVFEVVITAGIVIGSAVLAFFQTVVPAIFLPFCAVIYATYRFGPLGAASGVMATAIVGIVSIPAGMGAVGMILGGIGHIVWFFQFYLLCLLASALPLAALLAAREAVHAETLREKRMQDMAEKSSNVGHWVYNPGEDKLFWSDETYRIHGLAPGAPRNIENAVEAYHPDDRAMVSQCVDRAIAGGEPFSFSARIVMPDGSYKSVESRGEVEFDAHGEVRDIYGIIQDITERLASLEALEEARAQAVSEAAHARHLAETDHLTGVANRRKAIETLEQEIERYHRMGTRLSVAIIDVDHFKSINDRYGHGVGDEVLRRLTALCVSELRKCDLVGRLGGEEFVIILPGTSIDGAMALVERIREKVEAMTFADEPDLRLTISIGLTGMQSDADATFLLQAADSALYEAKRQGRNQLRFAA